MKFVDYYRVLGVKKSASATEIRKAYVALAKEHHPDRGGEEARMNRLNEAYETLKNPKARELYDEIHRARYSPEGPTDRFFTDMLSDAATRGQLRSRAKSGLITYGSVLLASGVGMTVGYGFSDSGLYLGLVPIALYSLICFLRSLFQLLNLTRLKNRKIKGWAFSSAQQSNILMFVLTIVLVLIAGSAFAFAGLERRKRSEPGNSSQTVLSETELADIEAARSAYDGCVAEFSVVTNQLNRLNQQSDTAFSSGDQQTQERLSSEREALVGQFGQKRNECNELQDGYNKMLETYRRRLESE